MKIATWNVNSIRVREQHVLDWLKKAKPDVLALQEIKVPEEVFPYQAFLQAGYKAIVSGQRTYNGVAVLYRADLEGVDESSVITDFPDVEDPQRRMLLINIAGVRIVNLYIPNGQSLDSDKYQYKLTWLSHLLKLLQQEQKKYSNIVVLGDFNIAPDDIDVHDPEKWQDSVLCSKPEREIFKKMLSMGLMDCFRKLQPNEQVYTWWDYRLYAFRRKMGLRIDHILASEHPGFECVSCEVDAEPRAWERPSDHAPVVATFKLK